MNPYFSMIVAKDAGDLIGASGKVPWHNRTDLQLFQALTIGKICVVGANTHKHLPPLPHRHLMVLSSDPGLVVPNGEVVGCLTEVGSRCRDLVDSCGWHPEVMVIGGSSVYLQFLPIAQRIYLSTIEGTHDGDTFFTIPEGWDSVSYMKFEGGAFQVMARGWEDEG